MSTILVIDKLPEDIIKSLESFKGVTFMSSNTIEKVDQILNSEQFDYILCEVDLIANESDIGLLREKCEKVQPDSEFYYIVPGDKVETDKTLKDEMFKALGVIRKPLNYSIIQLIVGTNLIDQSGIDNLFDKLKDS